MSLVEKRKIAFCGSDEIALPMLESICSLGQNIQITAILTQPDRRSGRGRKLNQNPIKLWGSKKNLEIRSPLKPGMDESNGYKKWVPTSFLLWLMDTY